MYVRDDLESMLWECTSGRELREMGFGVDVRHAARLNAYETVPHMRETHFRTFDFTQHQR